MRRALSTLVIGWGGFLLGGLGTAPPAPAQSHASGQHGRTELRLQPEMSVRFLEYRPVQTVELLGDTAVALLDFHAQQVEVRSLGSSSPVKRFGGKGEGPGEFQKATDVAVSANGAIYVADHATARVSVFGPDGAFRGDHTAPGIVTDVMPAPNAGAFVAWSPRGVFMGGAAPRVGRIRPEVDSVRTLFTLADAVPTLQKTPEEAPEQVHEYPVSRGGGLLFTANPYRYRITAIGSARQPTETFGREVALQYPSEDEMRGYNRRLKNILANPRTPSLSPEQVRRIREKVRERPKPFYTGQMFAADDRGNLWVTTHLRSPRDSTQVDHFPVGSRKPDSFVLRDRVVALAASTGRLIALVERLGDTALGRFGIDVYRIESRSTDRETKP